jgi:hypothetical protein
MAKNTPFGAESAAFFNVFMDPKKKIITTQGDGSVVHFLLRLKSC